MVLPPPPATPADRPPDGRPVVVEVPSGRTVHGAVRWAATEAGRQRTELQILLPRDDSSEPVRRGAFAAALAVVRATAPEVACVARPTREPVLRADRIASAEAALLVTGGPAPHLDDLIMSAYCPVVIVPEGAAAGTGTETGRPVVLALGPDTGPEALEFAFAEADVRGTGLRVVRTRNDPLVDLGRLLLGAIARFDAVDDRCRLAVDDQLTPGVLAHPDVPVEVLVVRGSCRELLLAFAARAG